MACLIKRGKTYYAQYYAGKKQKRVNLHTQNLQIAKEKLRQLESSLVRGDDIPLPTRTPLATVLSAFTTNLYATKQSKNADKIVSYLRSIFGPITPELAVRNARISAKARKCPSTRDDKRIEALYFEQITTRDITEFIAAKVRDTGIVPKTANRYREILIRLYNWAMRQYGIRMPGDKNPAAQVERYRERPAEIVFLSMEQIDEQLRALEGDGGLRAAVATYIFAGLRREELVWLRVGDVDFSAGKHGVIRVCAKTVGGEQWMPKTRKNRVVPISRALRVILDQYRPRDSDHGWYFPSPQGKRWDPDNLSRSLTAANDKAGLPWGCAEYRHTFGSHLAMRGESLYKVSELMGNSPEICRRHYAALMPESLVDSVEFYPCDGEPRASPLPPGTLPEEPPQGRGHLRLVASRR